MNRDLVGVHAYFLLNQPKALQIVQTNYINQRQLCERLVGGHNRFFYYSLSILASSLRMLGQKTQWICLRAGKL